MSLLDRFAAPGTGLAALFDDAGLKIEAGTDLFRFLRHPRAAELFDHLGHKGILVRRFAERSDCLRIGLPGDDQAFERVRIALGSWQRSGA